MTAVNTSSSDKIRFATANGNVFRLILYRPNPSNVGPAADHQQQPAIPFNALCPRDRNHKEPVMP